MAIYVGCADCSAGRGATRPPGFDRLHPFHWNAGRPKRLCEFEQHTQPCRHTTALHTPTYLLYVAANHSTPLIFPCAQIGQIARLLEIPPSRLKIPANSLVTGGDGTNTPLREALNTACGVRRRVQELAGVWREMPRDLELIVVLKVMRHIQRDSYRWVS